MDGGGGATTQDPLEPLVPLPAQFVTGGIMLPGAAGRAALAGGTRGKCADAGGVLGRGGRGATVRTALQDVRSE